MENGVEHWKKVIRQSCDGSYSSILAILKQNENNNAMVKECRLLVEKVDLEERRVLIQKQRFSDVLDMKKVVGKKGFVSVEQCDMVVVIGEWKKKYRSVVMEGESKKKLVNCFRETFENDVKNSGGEYFLCGYPEFVMELRKKMKDKKLN